MEEYMKGITDDPEIRYMIRAKAQKMTAHSEGAIHMREEINACLDGKDCDLSDMIGMVDIYIEASHGAQDAAKELGAILRVLKAQQNSRRDKNG